jgi:hypothetical protein
MKRKIKRTRVIQLHIWMNNKKQTWYDSEVVNVQSGKPQPGKRIVLDIGEDATIPEMKIAVAEVLTKYKRQLFAGGYYYVVAVVQRPDGEVGYRTIVPKVYPKED